MRSKGKRDDRKIMVYKQEQDRRTGKKENTDKANVLTKGKSRKRSSQPSWRSGSL
jgi:hypothetical protein